MCKHGGLFSDLANFSDNVYPSRPIFKVSPAFLVIGMSFWDLAYFDFELQPDSNFFVLLLGL